MKRIKVTLFPDPIVVEDRVVEEYRRDGMLLKILDDEADARGEQEVTDDGKEAADQDQAAGSPDEEGQGGGDVSPSVRSEGEVSAEGAVQPTDAQAGELRSELRGSVTPSGGVSQGKGRRPQGSKDA